MARFTVTLGELTTEVKDASPWLSRRRLRAWEQASHSLIDRITHDLGELVTTTELAQGEVEECDDEDCDCKSAAPRPSIGFRSPIGRHHA
jgi:hypothetical protein